MPLERKRVWNLARQIPGNILPVLITLPFLILSLQEIARYGPSVKGFAFGLAFFVVGWLAVNFLGLIGNSSLRKSIEMRFKDRYEYDTDEKYFVGFSRPGRHGLLDPHEDLGFLVFRERGLEYFGEGHQIELDWNQIYSVGKRPNIHSWLGLGGWVSIEANVGDKDVRLQIEPRVKATHFGNSRLRSQFIQEISKRKTGQKMTPA